MARCMAAWLRQGSACGESAYYISASYTTAMDGSSVARWGHIASGSCLDGASCLSPANSTRAQWVLDLCAAPGSKTSQLLDCVGPDGVVVANDRDPHRAYMLVRRCLALGHAAAKLLVTNHSAQKFPRFPGNLSADVGAGFDRVLADVPCSGDGTTRKNPSIWKRWLPGYGIKLHTVQLQIALRGAALLRVGGLLLYSTCSFNPIENEAVVVELLRRTKGSLELVDTSSLPESSRLTGLRRHEGLTEWQVG